MVSIYSNTSKSKLAETLELVTVPLQEEIKKLRQEIENLKSSNIDMIKLLTNSPNKGSTLKAHRKWNEDSSDASSVIHVKSTSGYLDQGEQ
jgi:hypothetical protein